MPKTIDDIDTPAVIIDVDRAMANIIRAQQFANSNGIKLRPHIKTHKLPYFAKKQIEAGALSLTTASTLHGFFVTEAKVKKTYSKVEKLALVNSCLNISTREVERKLVAISPDREKRESLTYTSKERLRLSISISEDLNQKLNRLKDIWSHSNLTTEQILERTIEMALERVDPVRIHARVSERRRVSK